MAEDEMVGWHHRLNGHEFEQTLGDSERQGNFSPNILPTGCWAGWRSTKEGGYDVGCDLELLIWGQNHEQVSLWADLWRWC